VISSEFKSLFRQIASATHPDKCADSNRDIFEKAVEAKNNNKTVNLLNLASDLKIKVNDISFSSIKEIEYDIKKTEEEIKKIHHSYPWIWYYAPFSERQKILDSFILDQV
jgi:chlorite dismutase